MVSSAGVRVVVAVAGCRVLGGALDRVEPDGVDVVGGARRGRFGGARRPVPVGPGVAHWVRVPGRPTREHRCVLGARRPRSDRVVVTVYGHAA